ncbi:cytochrome c oxidase polypeptide IV [Epithele typhae]|uniref:cytochrome c oxidase polypeptide IV n=1 Tax=Epithele typhae TaxID=378194 RepID=UPI0020084CD4|nr:cytochrome c oxidase polypeptide IV [Epithele typhae]KAH9945376.1 cytochrome c oxidase polypeptide IV [Epithele typhae]
MFAAALRSAARPASAARAAFKPTRLAAVRSISATATRRSGHAPPPELYGEGAKPGEVPTDLQQATGLERLQLLGAVEGAEVFDTEPLDASRVGTLADPIKVISFDAERIIGCTGCPADSHDLVWMPLRKDEIRRCPECGSAYAMDFQGEEHGHDHGHH